MNRETLFLIALEMDFPDILNLCKTSKMMNEAICKRESFWITKLRKDFGFPFVTSQAQNKNDAKEYYKILYLTQTKNPDYYARMALRKGWKELAKFIVRKGPSTNWAFLTEEAAIQNDMEMINFLLPKSRDFTLGARGAAKTGNIDLINYFLNERNKLQQLYQFDRSVYITDQNSIISAAIIGSMSAKEKAKQTFDYLFFLLSNQTREQEKREHYGALNEAARRGREDLIEYLIHLGFDNWDGALEGATRSKTPNALKLVKFFLKKGADLTKLEQPLYIATYIAKKTKSKKSYKIIKVLAKHGAFNQTNPSNNANAYEQALEEAEGDIELISFLKHLAKKYLN